MTRKQLFALYVCYLVPFIVGNAFLPFLPIYASRLGASPSLTGYYLAIAFASLAIGTMSAGRLSGYFQNRKLLILIGSVGSIVGANLMALAPTILLLTIATMIIWFSAGLIMATVLILTGMFAPEEQRGRTFGILATASSLAAIIGGSYAGFVIETWDYQGLFMVTSVLFIFPILAVNLLEDRQVQTKTTSKTQSTPYHMSSIVWVILTGSVLLYVASNAINMIQPLVMVDLDFGERAIGSQFIIAGLFTLPLPLIIGRLSDRIGRKWLLVFCYLSIILGLGIMVYARLLWHFWAGRIALEMFGTSVALCSAILTDVSDPDKLDTILSRFASTPWIGGVLGYVVAGVSIEQLGAINSIWLLIFFALAATLFILRINVKPKSYLINDAKIQSEKSVILILLEEASR